MNGSPTWWLLALEVAAFIVVAPRLWRASRGARLLSAEAGGTSRTTANTISVVIPARNEAARIAECITPLRGAPGVREIIVVDDESTDETASIATRCGATVVRGGALPAGWVGKIWALQQGINAATGDVIVTLDADARADAALPNAAALALTNSQAVLATVAPRFRTTSTASEWLHAALLTSLVYRHGAGAGRAVKDSVGNGQCMVFRRADAVQGDWCVRVRGEIIEDVALVRALVADGRRVEMFDGTRLLTVQMFDGFYDTLRGWGRSISLSQVDRPLRQWLDLATTALTLVAPLWLLVFGVATPVSALLLLARLGTLLGTTRTYERKGIGYWLSPLADMLAWLVVLRGVLAPSREWRGRKY